jgi:signal transduction histidine kinase
MVRPAQTGVLICSMAFALPGTAAVATNEVLTSADGILSLSIAQARQKIPVCITGVVTLCEGNWGGLFFVQDSTAGVFVNNTRDPRPVPGDVVQVAGVSHAGGYARDIISPKWKKLGTAPLPEARRVTGERLMTGVEDGQRVEVSGRVRWARLLGKTELEMQLAAGDYRFRAFAPAGTNDDANSLVGALVRIRGTAAASFNITNKQIVSVALYAPRAADFMVEELPSKAMWQAPFTPLRDIARYRGKALAEPTIRVKGVVTFQRAGQDIFLHDETGGLQVSCHDTNVIARGEIVEALGFPAMERSLPVLQDATLTRTREFQKPIVDRTATIAGIFKGFHHGDLIAMQGKLLDRSLHPLGTAGSSSSTTGEHVLTLQFSNYLFNVTAPAAPQFTGLTSIPIGSTLEVSGICLLQANQAGGVEAVQVLLPDAPSIRILQRPGWWTVERLLTGLGLLLIVSTVGALWTFMILRRNAALRLSIVEKVNAQNELQKAHDLLESRVEERTKELKFEMSARKQAEVRVEAVVAERTRIAQELHDTLLQGFTGLGLKLEALANSLHPSLETTRTQLQKLLEQSDEYLVEARRAVWELRSPSVETTADFSKVLMKVGERALQGTGIPLLFSTSGTLGKLAPPIEDNLLRICEEAVTNAAKHAHPTQVEVKLEFEGSNVQLRIRDNGCGFHPEGSQNLKNGHFGLIGMKERVEALSGMLLIDSAPGKGTNLRAIVPRTGTPPRNPTLDMGESAI